MLSIIIAPLSINMYDICVQQDIVNSYQHVTFLTCEKKTKLATLGKQKECAVLTIFYCNLLYSIVLQY